ncbi:hypothetical protein HGRIS_007326 [Hohenbuehelia grisea]|uniref:Potassium transport protein n=1 Tax=Hohenbuehelia grisea TaxID=104357 RepID=A0ABR3J4L3_9AGAR
MLSDNGGTIGIWAQIKRHLNFFRIHLIVFTFTPLVFSAVFYASNGQNHIPYIDALFNCISAMSVCGLATVDMSRLTPWQQTILFLQMCIGSPIVGAWLMVYIRRRYFIKKFQHIIKAAALNSQLRRAGPLRRPRTQAVTQALPWPLSLFYSNKNKPPTRTVKDITSHHVNDLAVEEEALDNKPVGILTKSQEIAHTHGIANPSESTLLKNRVRRLSEPGVRPSIQQTLFRAELMRLGDASQANLTTPPRNHVTFVPGQLTEERSPDTRSPNIRSPGRSFHSSLRTPTTFRTNQTTQSRQSTKYNDLGGFPMPLDLLTRFIRYAHRRWTERADTKLPSDRKGTADSNPNSKFDFKEAAMFGEPPSAPVSYVSFPPIVGRNSMFHLLTEEQLEELGGVEYRALTALLWIVAGYHILVQLIAFVIMAPYMSTSRFSSTFVPPQLHRPVSPVWFSLFQSVSAYSNTGMSLVDQSMVPFQRAYPTEVVLIFLILAGNTAFPIFLRFTIWILTKLVPSQSRANETLHFLLDHPRRCFLYLFPSHQTWFLLTVVVALTFTDWLFFLVLDIGNAAIDMIPIGVRIIVSLMQAASVRAAGFAVVSLLSLAPAVKVLYLIMMYVSVYPIALSVRATNVYEEQSLGIFNAENENPYNEFQFHPSGSRATVWSRYLALHARRQLAFDMWWLGLALFLVCVIERRNLTEEANATWFNIFSITFDLVSAYGSVGLSLGLPTQNYSFSGALKPASKLIICLVMLRGRHRGLPVAIDRAIMLPAEFEKHHSDEHLPNSFSPRPPAWSPHSLGGYSMTREGRQPSATRAGHISS